MPPHDAAAARRKAPRDEPTGSNPGFAETEEASSLLFELTSGPRYRGGLDGWKDGVLSGWAIDLADPRRATSLALETSRRRLAAFTADKHRRDLAALFPDNVAGFELELASLPAETLAEIERALGQAPPTKPLDPGALTLRLDGDGPRIDLGRSGITARKVLAQCRLARGPRDAARAPIIAETKKSTEVGPAEAALPSRGASGDAFGKPRFLAGVDGVFGPMLKGWAVDLSDPRTPVALRLIVDGEPIAELATTDHRAEIASVLAGNVAGFSLNLAALPEPAIEAIKHALTGVDPDAETPPRRVALRLAADKTVVELGVSAGALLAGLDPLSPAISVAALISEEDGPSAPAAPLAPMRKAQTRSSRALHWITEHVCAQAPAEAAARPARRFAAKLLADIEASITVSEAVKRHAAAIAPLFDPFHYLDRLSEPEEAIANPLLHYVLAGWREGVSPSPLFAPDFYRRGRPEAAGDPLFDYVREGATAGADPHPLFNVSYYRGRHLGGDEEIEPLAHYLEVGGRQRLDPSPLFDTGDFLAAYSLGDEIEAPLEAYLGDDEFRDYSPSPAFDAALYRHQIEIERGEKLWEPAFAHYLARGFLDETLLPNLLFDPAFYRERNKLAFEAPALLHYLSDGEPRGVPCHPFFSPAFYDEQRDTADKEGGALAHALAHPGALRSDPRMDDPIDPRLFAFVRQLVAERGIEGYYPNVYRDANPDIAGLDDAALEVHYRRRGADEKRLASLTMMMRVSEMRARDLPLGFVIDDYVSIYPDLKQFKTRFPSALFHWGRYGRQERRLVGKWLFRIADLEIDLPTAGAPLRVQAQASRVEVCILIHVFYPELLDELVAFAQNFRDVSFDIFINLVDISWTPELQEQVRAICPGAFVMLSHDAGRDVGGFTRLLEHVDLSRYDLFAFMHSKKSPHVAPEKGEYWRRTLLSAIAGSAETARECVRMFRETPQIGLIGAKDWRSKDMGKNVEQYERLLDLLGVRGRHRELDYVSGFMFLIRSDVVERLFETLRKLDFEYGGDKDLDFHIDGQIAHGVERAAPALVRQMGYEVYYR